MNQIYEKNLNKYYSQIDTEISKILIYEKKKINEIIVSLDSIFLMTKKTTKEYIIYLTLNESKKYYEPKIKCIEKKLKDYENKIKVIKKKYKDNEIILVYKEEIKKSNEINSANSFEKMNSAIRMTTNIESMSGNILINLEEQTKGMKNISNKISNTNGNIDESKNNLNEMIGKQDEDKKMIILLGGFLSFVLLVFLLFKIYKKYSK
jgi:hypothetical protein